MSATVLVWVRIGILISLLKLNLRLWCLELDSFDMPSVLQVDA